MDSIPTSTTDCQTCLNTQLPTVSPGCVCCLTLHLRLVIGFSTSCLTNQDDHSAEKHVCWLPARRQVIMLVGISATEGRDGSQVRTY